MSLETLLCANNVSVSELIYNYTICKPPKAQS